MARCRKPTDQDLMRLDAIAKHLKVRARYPDSSFNADVTAACLTRIAPIIDNLFPCTGEQIGLALGKHLCVTFEEVHDADDVEQIEERYLRGKREIGFAQLRAELRPEVDALLFERMYATHDEPDHWVAVLNLQGSRARAYWNRFHEISHRIAEPPQGILPFRRHRFEATNPVEALIDSVAAEIAFYGPAFLPLIKRQRMRHARLDFNVIDAIRQDYAPSASLLSAANAVVKHWPAPAALLTAEYGGRTHSPDADRALRIKPQAYSKRATAAGLMLIPNMRVPAGSPINEAFRTGTEQGAAEHLGAWGTSQGKHLSPIDVYTSARRLGERGYAVISA